MKRLLLSLALAFLCAAGVPAQNESSPPTAGQASGASASDATVPTVDQVLDHYIRALGGAQALSKLNSRVMKGTFEIPAQKVSGTAELDMQAPDRFFSEVSIPDGGNHILVYDGKDAWSLEPQSGLHKITGLELDQLRRSSQFLYESRLRTLFEKVRVAGKTMEGDRPVWVLQAAPVEGPPELFFFDADTGLLLRHDSVQATSQGNIPTEHRYSNYISVDGVQVPTLLRHLDPHFEWQVKFTEIRHNVPIDPAKFNKPHP